MAKEKGKAKARRKAKAPKDLTPGKTVRGGVAGSRLGIRGPLGLTT